MGHTRLGRLPGTRQWQEVVGLVGTGADPADIAAKTLKASKLGLENLESQQFDPSHSYYAGASGGIRGRAATRRESEAGL